MKLFDLNADTPTGDRGALMKGVWMNAEGLFAGWGGAVWGCVMRPFHIHAAAASAAPGRGMRIQAQAS